MEAQEVVVWICVFAFGVTTVLTLLHMVGWVTLSNPNYGKVLFSALILEIIAIFVGYLAGTFQTQTLDDPPNKVPEETVVPTETVTDRDQMPLDDMARAKAGWYGFSNSMNIDRERELKQQCSAQFTRVAVPIDKGVTSAALCEHLGLSCVGACGWEGKRHGCNDPPNSEWSGSGADGSRITLCQ